jgi:hypothetical protein
MAGHYMPISEYVKRSFHTIDAKSVAVKGQRWATDALQGGNDKGQPSRLAIILLLLCLLRI